MEGISRYANCDGEIIMARHRRNGAVPICQSIRPARTLNTRWVNVIATGHLAELVGFHPSEVQKLGQDPVGVTRDGIQ